MKTLELIFEYIGCIMFAAGMIYIPFYGLPQGLKKYADKQQHNYEISIQDKDSIK